MGLRYDSECLLAGTYRPDPAREVKPPKPDGGTRTLRLRDVHDRVVAKACAHALDPILDPRLDDNNFGFRKKNNVVQLLARLEYCAGQGGRPYASSATAFIQSHIVERDIRCRGGFFGASWLMQDETLAGRQGFESGRVRYPLFPPSSVARIQRAEQ